MLPSDNFFPWEVVWETHHAQGIEADGDQAGPGGGRAYTRYSQRWVPMAPPSTRWSGGNLKFRTSFYSSQVSRQRPGIQNDCTILASAQGGATPPTVRGCTPSLAPRWSRWTRRAPWYPNQYEHKGYTVGVVTRVRILFETLCNRKQIEIMRDPLFLQSQ